MFCKINSNITQSDTNCVPQVIQESLRDVLMIQFSEVFISGVIDINMAKEVMWLKMKNTWDTVPIIGVDTHNT